MKEMEQSEGGAGGGRGEGLRLSAYYEPKVGGSEWEGAYPTLSLSRSLSLVHDETPAGRYS